MSINGMRDRIDTFWNANRNAHDFWNGYFSSALHLDLPIGIPTYVLLLSQGVLPIILDVTTCMRSRRTTFEIHR